MSKFKDEIYYFFPDYFNELEFVDNDLLENAEEIRIRVGQPICIRNYNTEKFLSYQIKAEDILRILSNFSDNSIYSVQNEINSGFITIKGGHRIGISGTCIFENNTIKNIKYISSLNIRIAREVIGCSNEILSKVILKNKYNDTLSDAFDNTLILSPPGCGKTTIIRDMIRQLSDGVSGKFKYNVGLVDERSEIAAMYKGVPQNNIGKRTDVMNNCSKHIGMKMLIRSMGPQIIATDEIGGKNDEEAVFEAIYSGVKLLLTAHGESLNDVSKNFIESKVFKNIVVLKNEKKPGELDKFYFLEGDKYVSCF